jgi:hypothetical protein
MSLLPLINHLATSGVANDTSRRPSEKPLVFMLGGQTALIDNEWKILKNPEQGQCDLEINSVYHGLGLFNLETDPTESNRILNTSEGGKYADRFNEMVARLANFQASVLFSAANESQAGDANGACHKFGPPPPPAPPCSAERDQTACVSNSRRHCRWVAGGCVAPPPPPPPPPKQKFPIVLAPCVP